ncbi:MAG: hypothetical protein ABIW76_12480 [Fibrobacteria bacterium]
MNRKSFRRMPFFVPFTIPFTIPFTGLATAGERMQMWFAKHSNNRIFVASMAVIKRIVEAGT